MPSLVAKRKGNKLYYYVVESARVEGKPRIVHQAYLGTAEKLAEMVRERTAPIPLAAATREFGLPAALWSGSSGGLGCAALTGVSSREKAISAESQSVDGRA
jgi:hypothetical protein